MDAFCMNDLYYARPNADEQLWIVSRDTYLSVNAEIKGGTDLRTTAFSLLCSSK